MKEEKQKEYIGKKYGRLTILSFNEPRIYQYLWAMKVYSVNCICECGNLHTTDFQALKKGSSKSCGCWLSEWASKKMTKHGLSTKDGKKTSEYATWIGMKRRCNNVNNPDYPHYGGRGIKVSKEWENDFAQFYTDMGQKPSSDYSIERIDVNGNYCKENCKWILKTDQPKNTRVTILFKYLDKEMGLADWCKELNLNYSMMRHRVYDLKMDFVEAIKIPIGTKIQRGKQDGELNKSSKLTNEDVLFIRQSNLPRKELAKKFGLCRTNIDSIINRKTWKHI